LNEWATITHWPSCSHIGRGAKGNWSPMPT